MPFAVTWMDLEIIILSEVSQTEKYQKQYSMISLICRILKKMIQMNLFTKEKQTQGLRKQTYGYQMGRGGGINWEFEIEIYTLLYSK